MKVIEGYFHLFCKLLKIINTLSSTVHISNTFKNGVVSEISANVSGSIFGFGITGYKLAMTIIKEEK